jgi:UDP-glucose 4-epimerase
MDGLKGSFARVKKDIDKLNEKIDFLISEFDKIKRSVNGLNIAITGSEGLIGSFLKKRLEDEGHKIVLEIDLRSGNNVFDLKDKNINYKIDIMIHAAAHCKINESVSNPQKTFENNTLGTFSVFEFCRKNNIKKIIYFSSSRVLNKERNPYTASKMYGEMLCRGYYECYGMEYLIVRPSTVYGPFNDKTKRLMHIFMTSALKNEDLEIYGNPKTKTLDFTYVDDFVDGVLIAMREKWNEDYNISGESEMLVYELAKKVIEAIGSKSKIVIKNAEIAQPQEVAVDISKIKKLGYVPKIDIDEGVRRTAEFYKKLLD